MDNEAKKLPNERLRRERQRRGWTRGYIAEQIGIADAKTIGRWERGAAFPRAFYLQKLCELFGVLAQDLGFYQDEGETLPYATSLLSAEEQNVQITSLKQSLCCDAPPVVSALYGLPGVGKTTLAIELVNDREIRDHFQDGILWVEPGPRPDIATLLHKWGMLLGSAAPEIMERTSARHWASILHTVIGTRRMLLVIDDAWRCEDALAFKVGGPNCGYLLTTRIPSVALDFAREKAMLVRERNDAESGCACVDCAPTYNERQLLRAVRFLSCRLS